MRVSVKSLSSLRLSGYSYNLNFQLFMDMIYQVNQAELGINELLQLIELTYGEGRLYFNFCNKSLNLSFEECKSKDSLFLFLGHFGDEYPWHTETLTALVNKLETLSQAFDKDAKITLRNRKYI